MKKLLCIILLFLLLTTNVGQAQFNDSEPMFGQLLNLGHWSTDGLVFYWRGIQDKKVRDESLFRNHGTITGATWVGNALDFTGGGSTYVDIGTSLFAGWSQFTVVMRVKLDTIVDNGCLIGAWNLNGDRRILLRIDGATSNLEYFTFSNFQRGGDTGLDAVVGEWMHIVATRDGTFQTLYLNGIAELNPLASPGGNLQNGTSAVWIGDDIGNSGEGIDGQISHYSIYDRALSASEIAALYLNPALPMQQPPIWLLQPSVVPDGIIPIIQAHARRRRAG